MDEDFDFNDTAPVPATEQEFLLENLCLKSGKSQGSYTPPATRSASTRWKRLHEQSMMLRLDEMHVIKKQNAQLSKDAARKIIRKIPVEVLAREWLSKEDATVDMRAFLVDQVLPTLILGVERLLKEVDEKGLSASNVYQPEFNPINFLAQYLMRNNPRFSNFAEASPYVRGLREVSEEIKQELFTFEDNRLARIKAEARRKRNEREKLEQQIREERERRQQQLIVQFQEWNVPTDNNRVELSLLQNALRSFAEIAEQLPAELREVAKFGHALEPTDETGRTLAVKEFAQYISMFVEDLPIEVFEQFMVHMSKCAAAHRAAAERENRRIILTNLFLLCDHGGLGLLDRHRILTLFEQFWDLARESKEPKGTLRNPRKWPVIEVDEVDDIMFEAFDEEGDGGLTEQEADLATQQLGRIEQELNKQALAAGVRDKAALEKWKMEQLSEKSEGMRLRLYRYGPRDFLNLVTNYTLRETLEAPVIDLEMTSVMLQEPHDLVAVTLAVTKEERSRMFCREYMFGEEEFDASPEEGEDSKRGGGGKDSSENLERDKKEEKPAPVASHVDESVVSKMTTGTASRLSVDSVNATTAVAGEEKEGNTNTNRRSSSSSSSSSDSDGSASPNAFSGQDSRPDSPKFPGALRHRSMRPANRTTNPKPKPTRQRKTSRESCMNGSQASKSSDESARETPRLRTSNKKEKTDSACSLQMARASGSQQTVRASSSQQTARASGSQQTSRASGSQQTARASGSQQTARASGSQQTARASGSQQTARASGSQQTARASGSQQTARASGSQQTARASGSQQTARASGSQQTARASGSQQTARASGSQQTARASGSQQTARASGSQQTARASGSQQTDRTSSSQQTDRTSSSQQTVRSSGSMQTARTSSSDLRDGLPKTPSQTSTSSSRSAHASSTSSNTSLPPIQVSNTRQEQLRAKKRVQFSSDSKETDGGGRPYRGFLPPIKYGKTGLVRQSFQRAGQDGEGEAGEETAVGGQAQDEAGDADKPADSGQSEEQEKTGSGDAPVEETAESAEKSQESPEKTASTTTTATKDDADAKTGDQEEKKDAEKPEAAGAESGEKAGVEKAEGETGTEEGTSGDVTLNLAANASAPGTAQGTGETEKEQAQGDGEKDKDETEAGEEELDVDITAELAAGEGCKSALKRVDPVTGATATGRASVTFAGNTAFDRERTGITTNSRSQSQMSAFDESVLNVSQFVQLTETFLGHDPVHELFTRLVHYLKEGYEETEEEKMERLVKARKEAISAKRKLLMDTLFEKWDNDGSGFLEMEDVQEVMFRYKDGQEIDSIKRAQQNMRKKSKYHDARLSKREFRQFVELVTEELPGAESFESFVEFLTNSVERSYAERIRGEARKKWLYQIVKASQVSGTSLEPVYKAVFQALYRDAETHGGEKRISSSISMLERNLIEMHRGDLLLRYAACTPEDCQYMLGKALFKNMKGISFQCVDSGKPIHVPRVANHGNVYFWNYDRMADDREGSFIVCPLKDRKKRVFGVLGIDTLNDPHKKAIFITHEIQFFQGVAKAFSIAYHNVDMRRKLLRITESAISWIQRRCPHIAEINVYMVEPGKGGTPDEDGTSGGSGGAVLRKMMTTDKKGQASAVTETIRLERKDNLFRDYLFKCMDNSETVTADAYGERHTASPLRDNEGKAIGVVDISIGEMRQLPPYENKEAQRMLRLLQLAHREITKEADGDETTRVLEAEKDDASRMDIMFDRLMLMELRENVARLDPQSFAELKSYHEPPRIIHDIIRAALAVFNVEKAGEGAYDDWNITKTFINNDLIQQIKTYDPTVASELIKSEKVERFLKAVPHGEVAKYGSIPAQQLYNWVFVCVSLIEHTRKMRENAEGNVLISAGERGVSRTGSHPGSISSRPNSVSGKKT